MENIQSIQRVYTFIIIFIQRMKQNVYETTILFLLLLQMNIF